MRRLRKNPVAVILAQWRYEFRGSLENMITCVIEIWEIKPGVVTMNMVPNNMEGTKLELRTATLMDIGMRATWLFIAQEAKAGTMIEGQAIEEQVRATLESLGGR